LASWLLLAAYALDWSNYSWSILMPKVGNKEYPYTPAGKAAAKKAAAKSGKKMTPAPAKKK
jgi:hypothetical protein